jgi:hypothetical protein
MIRRYIAIMIGLGIGAAICGLFYSATGAMPKGLIAIVFTVTILSALGIGEKTGIVPKDEDIVDLISLFGDDKRLIKTKEKTENKKA